MKHTLSAAEKELMEFFWKDGSPKNFSEIMEYCQTVLKMTWKKQTVNTLLSRLIEKGFLSRERGVYQPLIRSEEEYEKLQATELIETMYHGSLRNFLTALGGTAGLNEREAAELRDFLKEQDGRS